MKIILGTLLMQSSKLWDMNSLKILSKVFEDFCQEGK